jgi:hypothetical protein
MDFLAYESHFISHLAPMWHALRRERGRFVTDPDLVEYAATLGIEATPLGPPRNTPTQPTYDGTPALVASYGDMKKGRRLGYGPFAFLEHGIGQSYAGDRTAAHHASYPGGRDRDDVELFLSPNEHSAARWRAAYPRARVEVVGSPRLDLLPSRQLDPIAPSPVVAISFHFPCSVVPETRPALGHYLGVLDQLAKRYAVVGHAHPRFFGVERYYRRLGIEYVRSFDEVCRRADVYVCDNSSTIYEFASTGRPVVVLNQPGYRKGMDHGLRFWDAAEVGVNVWHQRDLVSAVAEALEDKPARQKARERALDIVYAHRSGAAQRAAAAVSEWAGAREAVAA